MYDYETYINKQGKDKIKDYIQDLSLKSKTNKDARIRLKKIVEYLDLLVTYGTQIGSPITKHIDNDIWELRPLDMRIFYVYWKDNKFILLHYFHKKSQKTPIKEIAQAERNLKDWLERNGKNGKS